MKTIATLQEIWSYREMITSLVRKDLRGRYKGSVLDFFWTFLNPLLQLVVYTLVFGFILKNGIVKYYIFLFVALVPWNFFSSSVVVGARSILNEKNLVTKIYFPREILPIVVVTSSFVNMLLVFIVVFIVLLFSGLALSATAFLYLPIVLILEYFLALGFAFLTSALTVYFRDLEYFLTIIVMAWMYLTPVVYDISIVPDSILPLLNLNPMTPIVLSFRSILYYGQAPPLSGLLQAAVIALAVLCIGWGVFQKLKTRFVEEM